jgi:hypothetical protein
MKKTIIIFSITFYAVRSTATFYVTDYLSFVLCAPKFLQITFDPKLGFLTGQPFVAMAGNDKHLQSTKKNFFQKNICSTRFLKRRYNSPEQNVISLSIYRRILANDYQRNVFSCLYFSKRIACYVKISF